MEAKERARYLPHGAFYVALNTRVAAHFAATGAEPNSAPGMWPKTLIFLAWFGASYSILIFWAQTPLQGGLYAISLGLAMAGIGFNIQHDGGHGGYSTRRGVNSLMAFGLDVLGGSSYVWRWKHNVFHHSNPNLDGLDPDISFLPLCRLTPDQPRYRAHRFQHIYVWGLYSLLALKWQFIDDFKDVLNGHIGGRTFPRPRGWTLITALAGKTFFFGWALAVPLWRHPVGSVVLCYFVTSMTLSLVSAITFQLAHAVDFASFPTLDPHGQAETEWAVHQVGAAVDFAPSNRALSWYLGGLNYQIEHHLFPRVCHLHLRAVSSIVRSTCEEYGVPYRVHATARAAVASHSRWLRLLGNPPPSLPIPPPRSFGYGR